MDEEKKNTGLTVDFGQIFLNSFDNYPFDDIKKIHDFVNHLSIHGFANLARRNKPSHNVDPNDSSFLEKVKHAQIHNLWHYHIGIPYYDKTNNRGDWTSELSTAL